MWLYEATRASAVAYRWYWRLRLVGDRDAVPREGPLLVVSNHSAFLDRWLIGAIFPRGIHHLITRDWYDKSRFWTWFFRANGTIPTEEDPEATLRSVARGLEAGGVVGIFPEGRISGDGHIRKFRAGVSHIAASTGAPVLPLGIRGAYRSLPRHRRFPRPTRVEIHAGTVRTFPGSPLSERPPRAEIRRFRDLLFNDVCHLSGQDERAVRLFEPVPDQA